MLRIGHMRFANAKHSPIRRGRERSSNVSRRSLPARGRHVARECRRGAIAINHEIMSARLDADRAVDGPLQIGIVVGGAHDSLEICRILLPEAGVEDAGRRDPHPAAAGNYSAALRAILPIPGRPPQVG